MSPAEAMLLACQEVEERECEEIVAALEAGEIGRDEARRRLPPLFGGHCRHDDAPA